MSDVPEALQPLKSWSHPFKDTNNPLLQLTQLAKAKAGFYPIGTSGLCHGGVHFDSGTAGALDQSSVHCLADGEVVAYRIDEHSPKTTYFIETGTVQKPFSCNFVLVRHRLQPPKIEGSPDVPPSLTFYSLYMHLQDWAVYHDDVTIARPAFWPEGETRRVKATVTDVHPGHSGQQGLNVRNQAHLGKVIGFLQRGAEVTVSGDGHYRKLENTNGPDVLKEADGSLRGYLSIHYLVPIAGGEYRVNGNPSLRVHAEASVSSATITELPNGTEVTISGEGECRKLVRVNQYVYFNSLEGAQEPMADRIVVLDQPVAIKAGDLIGHIGDYQDSGAEQPEKKLHVEVFSGDDVEDFIKDSRDWAQRLPADSKTWLKLAKGTAVVAHQACFSATQPPTLSAAHTPSATDLLVPKSLLDGLSAESKIAIPATSERKACNWYRLQGLLNDADNTLPDGWVREEVSVTPWVSPWSWEGYDVIFNYDTPRQALASFLRAVKRFSDEQLERHGPLADASDKGSMKTRLYDIIKRNHDGTITAEELKHAIGIPAYAQSLSQLIIYYESEWHHTSQKWDALDDVLGHSGSTPHLNWVAEKERIKQISWWGEVAEKVGLPLDGEVYHFHPVGLVVGMSTFRRMSDLIVRQGQVTFDAEGNDIPNSPYFSRRLHWPGGASGVTLGRGYDMRHRTRSGVCADLIAAGVDAVSAENFSRGAGLSDQVARDFVSANRDGFGEISKQAQRILFEDIVYPRYVVAAQQRYSSIVTPGSIAWEELNDRVRDVAVDLTYQQGSIWERQIPYVSVNDRSRFAQYIQDTPELVRYELGRNRVRYLRGGD
ncbi:hypothetical protein [Pseudomonas fluorescens]|uniref:Uncharacterized protein n=1 Tax=Pseudomonas fluorescens TaxID=294 RepID=A0A5E6XXC3_PSEFL|nr:hypothetical protein [Pseudomonas fluorescens]VVN45840.1 hypothetical protein PS655_05812 [Pseudomonas fluorescens]